MDFSDRVDYLSPANFEAAQDLHLGAYVARGLISSEGWSNTESIYLEAEKAVEENEEKNYPDCDEVALYLGALRDTDLIDARVSDEYQWNTDTHSDEEWVKIASKLHSEASSNEDERSAKAITGP